jgi:hypothetical protein
LLDNEASLRVFLGDAAVPIDNNTAERTMRRVALGREGESRVSFEYDRAASCASCTHTAGRVARVSYALGPGSAGEGVDELAYDARGRGVGLAREALTNSRRSPPIAADMRDFTVPWAMPSLAAISETVRPPK